MPASFNKDGVLCHAKGKPLSISWSGTETYWDCERKWYYGYIERLRDDTNESLIVGNHVHDMGEAVLKGEVVDEASRWYRILLPGLLHSPTAEEVVDEEWGVEEWVRMPCGPLTLVGKVDFFNLEQGIIGDWKTTKFKDFRYAKTPKALRHFGQPLTYAYALFHKDPPETVDFQHINLLVRGKPDAMPVWAKGVPWSEVEAKWKELEVVAQEMYTIATTVDKAEDVTPQPNACKKYGGCPHAKYCSASPINRDKPKNPVIGAELMANSSSVMDRINALRKKAGVEGGAITPSSDDKPIPTEAKPTGPAPGEGLADAVKATGGILSAMQKVPEAVLKGIAASAGVTVTDIIERLGLVNQGGSFVPRPEAEVVINLEAGYLLSDAMDLCGAAGVAFREQLAANDLTAQFGILVPVDFEGGPEEAYAKYAPSLLPEKKATPTADPDQSDVRKAETHAEFDDNAILSAKALVEWLETGGSGNKTKAGEIAREACEWERVSSTRWDAILMAAEGKLVFHNKQLTLADTRDQVAERKEAIETAVDTAAEAEEAANKAKEQIDKLHLGNPAEDKPVYVDDTPVTPSPEIFIDCLPVDGSPYLDFADWIRPLEEEVARSHGVGYYGLLEYGQGPAKVTALLLGAIHEKGNILPTDMPLVISSFHPLANVGIAALRRVEGARWVKACR